MSEQECQFWLEQWQWIRERAAYLRAQKAAAGGIRQDAPAAALYNEPGNVPDSDILAHSSRQRNWGKQK